MFRSLRHVNFRLFFLGQGISVAGMWMQIVAVSWLSYRLTGSPFLVGCVMFASQIPGLFLAPFAGVAAERCDRRNFLVLLQALLMAQAVVLTVLVMTRTITIEHILALSFFMGVVNAFEFTIRQSFLVELVDDKKDLSNAIALNSMIFNSSRLIGPTIAGILIGSFGEGICFLVNACSYGAVIGALLFVHVPKRHVDKVAMDFGKEVKEGLRYAYGFLPIRLLLLSVTLFSVVAASIHTLLPVFVKEVFQGGPRMFGFLLTVSGLGAFLGTIYLARKRSVKGFAEMVAIALVMMGIGMAGVAATKALWVFCIAAFEIGLAMMVGIGGGNMILQTIVHDDKRGRVMSLYMVALMGTAPLGSLGAGTFATKFGVHATLWVGSMVCFIGAFIFWKKLKRFNLKVRPIYIEKGIVPKL